MAATALKAMLSPRTVQTGGKLPNIPVIEHPKSKMKGEENLNIVGTSELGSSNERENTFVALRENGKIELGLDRENLPPLNGQKQNRERMMSWPPMHLAPPSGDRLARIHKRRLVHEACYKKNVTPEELEFVISEKVSNGFHSLKYLFKANDPAGQGNVSREALMRILFNLCGYIPPDVYNKLLRRIGLRHAKTVSFEDFIGYFKPNKAGSKEVEWIRPINPKDIYLSRSHPEEHLRDKLVFPREQFVPASYVSALLKAKASKGEISLRDYFPASCLEKDGIILPPQFREAVAILGYRLTDDEFRKLWARFDLEGVGSLKPKFLFKLLDLDTSGNSKAAPFIRRSKTSPGDDGKAKEEQPSHLAVPKRKAKIKQLDNILDQVMFKLDEPYNQLQMAFETFDFLADNCVSRVDFRKVLSEYGMNVTATELEYFLSRGNIKLRNGTINYRAFLAKFSNRSQGGMVFRIVNDRFHVFSESADFANTQPLSAEQLEAKLVEFLHKDFLKMIGSLQSLDQYGMGVVTQMEFRRILESCLMVRIKDRHWEKMREQIGLDEDGLVPYTDFMNKITAGPGVWNKKREAGYLVSKIDRIDTPSQVTKLRQEEKEKEILESQKGRSVEQILDLLREEMKTKVGICSKAYQQLDPKMTGRLGKEQLVKVLERIGVTLIRQEVDRLFKHFDVATDGLFTWTKFLGFVTEQKGSVHNMERAANASVPKIEIVQIPQAYVETNNNQTMEEKEEASPPVEEKVNPKGIPHFSPVESLKLERIGQKSLIVDNLMEKIRNDVTANWEHLKFIFRQLDPEGSATVPVLDVKECMNTFEFNLTEDEVRALCERFDFEGNGRFHYMPFMESYTVRKSAKRQPVELTMNKPAKETTSVSRRSSTSGELTYNKVTHKLQQRMVKEWKSLRRAFKKMDSDTKGYLTVAEFRTVVENCGIRLTQDDLYHILTEFDSNMDGKICYEEFIQSLLKT